MGPKAVMQGVAVRCKGQDWWGFVADSIWAQESGQSRRAPRFLRASVQLSLSRVRLFATPWITARQVSLLITSSQSSPKLMCIKSVMPSSHLILCRPLLLLPPVPPSIRIFFNESALRMRWPKYWSFSLSISPSNEHPELISFRMDWLDLSSRDSQESEGLADTIYWMRCPGKEGLGRMTLRSMI